MIMRLVSLVRKLILWITRSDDPAARPRSPVESPGGSDHDAQKVEVSTPPVSSNSPGQRDSPPVAGDHADYADVVIGLDLGTSCSKVVVRLPFIGGGVAYSVPLVDGVSGERAYLCPTVLVKSEAGFSLVSGTSPISESVVEVDKLELLKASADPNVVSRAGLYLALLVRRARVWFLSTHGGTLQNRLPRWSLSLGVPSASASGEEFHENFRRAAYIAWVLADKAEPSLSSALEALSDVTVDPSSGSVDIVPEVIAEVMGYALSQVRRPGLHLLVDVGAGTVDICGFLLHSRRDEDVYPILHSYVGPFGVHMLHRHRLKFSSAHKVSLGPPLDRINPTSTIPATLSELVTHLGPLVPQAETHERIFLDAVRGELLRVVAEIRKRRDPYSRAWEEGVPIFLAGGGGRHAFYQRLLREADEVAQTHWHIGRFKVVGLPIPPELDSGRRTDEEFSRLAVAYGLSFTRDERGEIRPESDVSDVPRHRREVRIDDRYIGKEMV